jgi:NAD(P)-dependent dehydrogenase (short-subunit alcohol dehydrogenase family)
MSSIAEGSRPMQPPSESRRTSRRVLVTGGANGIGLATTKLFLDHGDELLVADLEGDALASLRSDHPAVHTFVYDQGDPASIAALAAWAGEVDVLVNNAGMLLSGPLQSMADEDIVRLVAVDLVGPMLITRRIGAGMVARRHGVVVNVSSQLAFCGAGGRSIYSACKAALSHFTGSIAAEWGEAGVRVVAVAPGRTITRMTEGIRAATPEEELVATVALRRLGKPGDIAEAIHFLASDKASYVTGTTLVVDGGYLVL